MDNDKRIIKQMKGIEIFLEEESKKAALKKETVVTNKFIEGLSDRIQIVYENSKGMPKDVSKGSFIEGKLLEIIDKISDQKFAKQLRDQIKESKKPKVSVSDLTSKWSNKKEGVINALFLKHKKENNPLQENKPVVTELRKEQIEFLENVAKKAQEYQAKNKMDSTTPAMMMLYATQTLKKEERFKNPISGKDSSLYKMLHEMEKEISVALRGSDKKKLETDQELREWRQGLKQMMKKSPDDKQKIIDFKKEITKIRTEGLKEEVKLEQTRGGPDLNSELKERIAKIAAEIPKPREATVDPIARQPPPFHIPGSAPIFGSKKASDTPVPRVVQETVDQEKDNKSRNKLR